MNLKNRNKFFRGDKRKDSTASDLNNRIFVVQTAIPSRSPSEKPTLTVIAG